MLAENDDGVFLALFNWDDTEKQFSLSGFENSKITPTSPKQLYSLIDGKINISLEKHSSVILKVESGDFDLLRTSISDLEHSKNFH